VLTKGSDVQYARRNEPRDECCGGCCSRDRDNFEQCRIIICEHCHESEIDRSAQTDDSDSILPDFAKHRFATHSAKRAIFLERIDDAVRKYPRNSRGWCVVSVKNVEHGHIQGTVYGPTHHGTDRIERIRISK
jgi:hypothetical protein